MRPIHVHAAIQNQATVNYKPQTSRPSVTVDIIQKMDTGRLSILVSLKNQEGSSATLHFRNRSLQSSELCLAASPALSAPTSSV